MADQLPAGQVTIADLYRELTGMRTDVAKALERLAVHDSQAVTAATGLTDHETRIRRLEQFKYLLLGGAALAGTAGGWLAEYIASRR
jgi:hypothetical protein